MFFSPFELVFFLGLAKLICTRESSMTNGMHSETSSSEDEMPGEANMWNPLLCTAYTITMGYAWLSL